MNISQKGKRNTSIRGFSQSIARNLLCLEIEKFRKYDKNSDISRRRESAEELEDGLMSMKPNTRVLYLYANTEEKTISVSYYIFIAT